MLISVSQLAPAASWETQTSVSVGAGVDDNVALSEDSPGTTYSGRTTAALALRRVTEIWDVRAAGRVGYTTYFGSTEGVEDSDFQHLTLDAAYESERARWGFEGGLRRDKTLIEIGDPDADVDPGADIDQGLVEESVRRTRLILRPSFEYELTERLRGALRYEGVSLNYDDRESIDVEDSLTHEVIAGTTYRLSRRATVGADVEALYFRGEDEDDDVDSYGLVATLDYRVSERTRVAIAGGARHAEPRAANGAADDDTGALARLEGRTRGENWTAFVALERRLRPGGEGLLRETDQLRLRASRDLSPRVAVSFSGRAFEARSATGDTDGQDNRSYVNLSPEITYRLTPAWYLTGAYRHQWVDRDPGTATSNAAFVEIEYRPPSEVP
ncbi:hypothetical protein [Arhodomonas sp. AD133]|uniref:hypothetical protein n=1 Tax=Arhodomonas sp. AD133 TaxID=3415009 RepID=UPI003EBACF37